MPVTILVGTQWGDEGKGKATDLLAARSDFVVRYQGGNNAGHTIVAGGYLLKLQLVPSGILYPHVTPVIADGVVVDPATLLEEVDTLTARRNDVEFFRPASRAHLTAADLALALAAILAVGVARFFRKRPALTVIPSP